MGLDAYFSEGFDSATSLRVIGPYSVGKQSAAALGEVLVQTAMRRLVDQLEIEVKPATLAIFGITGDLPDSSELVVSVMGENMAFLPNPSLRSSLWDNQRKEERAEAYSREWMIDASENTALHQSGLQFYYAQRGQRILVHGKTCTEFGAVLARNLPSLILLEVLAEQGFAYLRGFDERRHFEELVFAPSWFAVDTCEPSVSVA